MDVLQRVVSRPQLKPYRTGQLSYSNEIHTDDEGLLKFSPGDIENPKEWSRGRRWFITCACIVMVMNASMASSSPSGCLASISDELGVSMEVAELTITFFLIGFCAGPCFWAPLSEFYGRKVVFTGTFVLYVAFTFMCAFANNITALLIGRFLCGTFIGGILTNAPGVFADLWGPVERAKSVTLFSTALQMGPAVGPITSGFYQLKLNWRWNFYQLLWLGAFSMCLLPLIPETLPSRTLMNKARRIRAMKIHGYEDIKAPVEMEDRSLLRTLKIALSRPWKILLDPISGLLAIYVTVFYSLFYMLFTLYPVVFIEKRGWNAGVGELPLIGVAVGAIFAGVYIWWDQSRLTKKIANGYQPVAEDALPVGMVGAVVLPIAMFWMAWTGGYNSIHWIVPTIGGVVLSFAISALFVACIGYLSESYLMYAASAQAANQIVRSAIAAVAPLYSTRMFHSLGVAGAGSLIAGIALLLMPIPFAFYRYGRVIREKSKFAPTPAAPAVDQRSAFDEEKQMHGQQRSQDQKQQLSLHQEQPTQSIDDTKWALSQVPHGEDFEEDEKEDAAGKCRMDMKEEEEEEEDEDDSHSQSWSSSSDSESKDSDVAPVERREPDGFVSHAAST